MKSYLDCVQIQAKVRKKKSRLTRLCILSSVFLVAVMFGLADYYVQGMIEKTIREKGNWHYRLSGIGNEELKKLQGFREIKAEGWVTRDASGQEFFCRGDQLSVWAEEQPVFREIYGRRLEEGEYPEAGDEILLSSAWKNKGMERKERIAVEGENGEAVSFQISGFFEEEKGLEGILTPEGMKRLGVQEESFYLLKMSRLCLMPRVMNRIQESLSLSDGRVEENEELLGMEGQIKGSSVNQIYQVAFLLGLLVLLASVLMISSSLNSAVCERKGFFGLLRCMGATQKQTGRLVRREGIYWCVRAMPLGIGLSVLAVSFLSFVMRRISPQWFAYMPVFRVSWLSVAAGVLLGLGTVLLSARFPAKLAGKISPVEAVSDREERPAGKAVGRSRLPIEIALGLAHGKGNRRNYWLMTGSFAVCMTLFLSFIPLISFMENALRPAPWTPELSVVSEKNTCSIDKGLLLEVQEDASVKRAYGRQFAYQISGKGRGKSWKANLISYEENQFQWAGDSLMEGSVEKVMEEEGQVLFVQNGEEEFHTGERLTLLAGGREQTVTVGGVLSDCPLAREEGVETLLCSEKTFEALTGEKDYTILDIQFEGGADEEDAGRIKGMFGEGVTFVDSLSAVQQQRRLFYAFAVLVYSFLLLILLITAFHVVNTVRLGTEARKKQCGMMRAVGMEGRQVVRMVAAEAFLYTFSGIALGLLTGLFFHWIIFVSLITNLWGIPWNLPLREILVVCFLLLAATAVSVAGPAKRLIRSPVVELISKGS